METNVLVALKNLLECKENELLEIYKGKIHNRANNMGDALEYYIKDLFCNTISISDFNEKDKEYGKYLSYLGNSNNPPDFIIKSGPAVEVKKIENVTFGEIALNSSDPKDYLHSSSTLISKACRSCEDDIGCWTKKDMIYVIGNVVKNKLNVLWFLYGDCYAADTEVYKKIKTTIQVGVTEIQGVEFSKTKELGKIHKVDPLGITNLRIRGMWSIKHPMKVFDYVTNVYNPKVDLQIYCLMTKAKYDILPKVDQDNLEKYIESKLLKKQEVQIKNPNNPVQYLDAVLFEASL